jgi:CRP/FNR family transcriptional regulator, putaive post-exponential-phase nitrogen-starvation regulator
MKRAQDLQVLQRLLEQHELSGIFDQRAIQAMELVTYGKGDIICSDGGRMDQLLLLVKGKLKVYKTLPNGKSILIRFYKPLGIVGDMELLTDFTVKGTVEAVGECLFIAIKYQDLNETAYQDPAFLRFIIKQLSQKLYTFSNASSLNLLYPLETRFASYLVSITVDENDHPHIEEIRTSKLTEIAELLGASYRHLNRVISQFVSAGLVERTRGSLYVKDIEQLKKLANGNLYN